MTQAELATAIPLSQSQVSAIERGDKGTTDGQIRRMDEVLTTDGTLARRWEALNRSGIADWFKDMAELERQASDIWQYHPLLIPGLLQTEDYARTIIRVGRPHDSDAQIEEQVQARIARQRVLSSEHPPWFVVVLDEPWLRRPTGGREIMKAQLEHLVDVSTWRRVLIQVVPAATKLHPGLDGAFQLFTVPDRDSVLYTETRAGGYPLDRPDAVDDYTRVFSELRGASLPEEASRDLLKKIIGDL